MSVKGDLSEFNKMAGQKLNQQAFFKAAFDAGYTEARIIHPGQVAKDKGTNKNRINAIVDEKGKLRQLVFG